MANGRELDKPNEYQITIQGSLEEAWSDWFDGFAIAPQNNGETVLTGTVADQAALYGLLLRLHNLGLPLLAVKRVEEGCAGLSAGYPSEASSASSSEA